LVVEFVEFESLEMMARAGVVCRRAVNVGVDSLIVVYSWLGRRALWHQWMVIQLMRMSSGHSAVGLEAGGETSWWFQSAQKKRASCLMRTSERHFDYGRYIYR